MSVKKHYDTHLANVYSWMLGDFGEKMQEQVDYFRTHDVLPCDNRDAIDLGAGNGIQSVALAHLGFDVTAVDFSRQLLDELDRNKQALSVSGCERDILQFMNERATPVEVIVCMGDTLTHLNDLQQIGHVIARATALLVPAGKLVLSFRDLSEDRTGIQRFFHVRSDDNRSMTCFLEYFQEVVMVHDIITEKRENRWTQAVSAYPKVRLPVQGVKDMLRENNMMISHEEVIMGMTYLVSYKSP